MIAWLFRWWAVVPVLDMRDTHLSGPYCAFVMAGGWELGVRGRSPAEARRRARILRRELTPRRLILGLI